MVKEYTVVVTDEEEKALFIDMVSIQAWLDNAIHNKARQCMDKIILTYSDKQPRKIPADERAGIVRDAEVESAAERQARLEADALKE